MFRINDINEHVEDMLMSLENTCSIIISYIIYQHGKNCQAEYILSSTQKFFY